MLPMPQATDQPVRQNLSEERGRVSRPPRVVGRTQVENKLLLPAAYSSGGARSYSNRLDSDPPAWPTMKCGGTISLRIGGIPGIELWSGCPKHRTHWPGHSKLTGHDLGDTIQQAQTTGEKIAIRCRLS